MPFALLSVFDKSGIAELAEGLHAAGWQLLSSGGTAREVAARGVPVTDVADITGLPAILGHRVVTLHPKIHGGILADMSDPSHRADLAEYGIEPIDLVVVNLYPFTADPSVELIDIGGPAMVRAAAKNHDRVAVVVDPEDYEVVLGEVRAEGQVSGPTRRALARKAFATTAAYDMAIAGWLDVEPVDDLPATLQLALRRVQPLRYGENPHQLGARYRFEGGRSWWDDAVQHGGKELSYLNLYDTEAAWRLVHRFDDPACVIVKHANPCGVATAEDIGEAYVLANACDPVSAFGGIVAVNRTVSTAMADALAPVFTEVVVAPGYEPEALTTLTARKNVRVLTRTPAGGRAPRRPPDRRRPARPATGPSARRPSSMACRHRGDADERAVGRPRVRLGRVRGGLVERHRSRQAASGVRNRRRTAEPSRLGAASPRPAPVTVHRVVCAPATPSSPSATASTRSSPPA